MSLAFANIATEMGRLRAEVKKLELEAIEEVKKAATVVFLNLFENTPVWTGETVRNYKAGLGGTPGGFSGAFGGEPPPGTTPKGLGGEQNRGANENLALSTMQGVVGGMTKLENVFITNTIDAAKWDLIDSGSAPTPDRARNPGGVSVLAEQTSRSQLKDFK